VTVGVDDARHGKRSATAASRLAESKKSIVAPLESTARYKYNPLAFNAHISFVHAPTVVGRFEPRAQTSFHFRGVTLDPSNLRFLLPQPRFWFLPDPRAPGTTLQPHTKFPRWKPPEAGSLVHPRELRPAANPYSSNAENGETVYTDGSKTVSCTSSGAAIALTCRPD
jgi:hypothetical protein